MKKLTPKTLRLETESLRVLAESALRHAVGGTYYYNFNYVSPGWGSFVMIGAVPPPPGPTVSGG